MWIADLPAYLVALTPARVVVWPALGGAGASLAIAVRDGRRRTALNECLHELRRPLQALALLANRDRPGGEKDDGPVEMAAAALARLEWEINGEAEGSAWPRETFAVRPLLEAARRRWAAQAAMRRRSLTLRWNADEAVVDGDRFALAAALDNLLANALEHGGERIELVADLAGERLCLAVVDSGSGAGRRARERDADVRRREAKRPKKWKMPASRVFGRHRRGPRSPLGNFSGRSRHGHGLRLVRRTAVRHGGAFALHQGDRGTSAVLELPLAPTRARREPRSDRPAADARRPELVIRREGP